LEKDAPKGAMGSTQEAIDALAGVGASPAPDAVTFREPTPLAPVFRPPESGKPRPGKTAAEVAEGFGDTALRTLGEQLRGGPQPRRRLGTLGLVFAGVVLVAGGAFAARWLLQARRTPTKTLLERYREELAREPVVPQAGSGVVPEGSSVSSVASAPPAGTGKTETPSRLSEGPRETRDTTMPAALRPEVGSSAPSKPDEQAIRAELERAYGTKRPTIPFKGQRPQAMPAWVKGVQVVDAKAAVTDKKLGGRYGDHLRLQLRSNLDSRLCGSGTVEAALVRPYLVDGALVLPSRTLAYGQCSGQGGRLLITFTRLRLPEGAEAHFEGLAMDVTDGKPGLLARRLNGTSAPSPQPSTGGEIARGAASTVLSAATGGAGLAGQVANGAGQTAINTRPDPSPISEDALLLDAGAGLDVFIREPF
jgi:hypothetical protein